MKVRIAYTAEVSDEYRRAINAWHGRPGLATREDVRSWIERFGTSEDDNVLRALEEEGHDGED